MISAFLDQLSQYKSENNSDFRRMNLVYAFQDVVNSVNRKKDITAEIESTIQNLLDLETTDPNIMTHIGFDLLEYAIKLQLIYGLPTPKLIKDLSLSIAYKSKPKELLIELNAMMAYMKIPNEEQTIKMFKNMSNKKKNMFKTIATFYVSIMIQRIEEKHLKNAIQELYIYVELLEYEVETVFSVLGSSLMNQLIESFLNRSLQIKIHANKEISKFVFSVIKIYEKIQRFKEFQIEFLKVFSRIFEDFDKVLNSFDENIDCEGILTLANLCVSGNDYFCLPLVLSATERLRILLLNSIKAYNTFPNLFINVLKHTVYHLEDSVSLSEFDNPYTKKNFKELFENLLNVCGSLLSNDLKTVCWGLVKELLDKVKNEQKVFLIREIVKDYQWDLAKGMLIDWVCSALIRGKVEIDECFQLLEDVVIVTEPLELIDTLQAAFKLHKLIKINALQNRVGIKDESTLIEKYESIYKEFSLAYDANPNIPKLGLLIQDIKSLTNNSI